jgi:TonB-dependent SusC/RagA subfamily outer membrane receptor
VFVEHARFTIILTHNIKPMSIKQLGLLRLLVLLVLLYSINIASAQSYQKINNRIDSLTEIGLPKSALGEVDKLDELARKEKNVPMQIKAVLYRMKFQSFIEENALVSIINRLKLDIQQASYPAKPVLQSLLADMYHQYYEQNRWQFSQRSHLEKPSDDFTQWDIQTIISETTRLYHASLSEAKIEQSTPIDVLDGILKGDTTTRYLRPTLYDLLVHRALDFFLSDEPTLTKPKLTFVINDARFFSDNHAFVDITIKTADTASTYYIGLRYLQQATLFHLQNHHDEALADLDIKRMDFLHNKTTLADKDSLYTTALKQIASTFSNKPISTDAWVALAKYEQRKDSLKSAMQYARKAIDPFPESMGGQNADILMKELQKKELSISVENLNIPGEPLLAQIQYRNIKTAGCKIYRLTQAQNKQYEDKNGKYYSRSTQSEGANWLPLFLKQIKSQQEIDLQLPAPQDYRSHRTEFKINALKSGNYLIWAEDKQSTDSSLIHCTGFEVSRIAYTSRENPYGDIEALVVDRKTGKPLKNVAVKMSIQSYRSHETVIKNGFTDKAGVFRSKNTEQGYARFQMIYKGDTLSDDGKYIHGTTYNKDEENPKDKTILFTDRQIYRPGQTIYFKGLQIQVLNGKSTIETNKDVTVSFTGVNRKRISTLNLRSNEFGTFNGSFIIPQNLLNGVVSIETGNGQIFVKVEEYKRNSIQVEFSPVTESYKLNDSIKVKGLVKAFSGYGLSQARVAYHITRTQNHTGNYPDGYKYRYITPEITEIKIDTLKTNDQGSFQITFKAVAGETANRNNIIYNYAISMDVTDAAGETHSANTEIKVANNNIAISAYIPDEYLAQDTSHIAIGINNLNGRAQKGSISVQVYALQSQCNLVKKRLWDLPDQFIMTKKDFKTAFPYFAYRNEDDYKTWPRGKQISDVSTQVNDSTLSYINLWSLRNQPSGPYQIVISARNEKGDTTSITKYVNLIADRPKPVNIDHWIVPVRNIVKPGTQAEFLVGIDEPVNVLMEKYKGKHIISSQWLHIDKGQQSIKIPIDVNENDINVQFLMAVQNRVYSSYQKIQIAKPDRSLNIRMVTFRNILQPGEKEQWKLQVSTANNQKLAAEMVAALYDASLDDIAPAQNWSGILNTPQPYKQNYFGWNIYGFVRADNTQPLIYRNYIYQQQNREYENLNMLGYSYYGGYNNNYHQLINRAEIILKTAQNDKKLEADYIRNAVQVKNGVDISGKLTDSEDGSALPGVSIFIKGTKIRTGTNSSGYFKIKVPVNGTLTFSFIGYATKEVVIKKAEVLNIALQPTSSSLDELVVVGYGTKIKRVREAIIEEEEKPLLVITDAIQGRMAGVSVTNSTPGGNMNNIMIRGGNSLTTDNNPLYVIDGVVPENSNINMLNSSDIESISILKGESATALYGARAANGVIIIKTKKGGSRQPISTRKNFNETAFFYPQLRTDEKGEILIDFTIPEALTKWRFKAFAHTQDLNTGYLEQEIVTQKQLSISANMPRFLREGDTITVSARLVNLTTTPLQGKVRIQFFNALNMQPIFLLVNATDGQQSFDMAGTTNKAISFKLFIPAGLDALTYRLTADAGQFTDGEENTLPVLVNRMLVTESMPMMVRPGQKRTYTFDKLINQTSTTLKNKILTLEYTQNPVWYAIQALPYMMEFPYECSEQIFSRYYANSLATNLVNHLPIIKQVFDKWKNTNSPELLSNLEKNQELKAILIEETPWLRDAMNESEQKKRIALLFDLNKMSNELQLNLDKLQKKQLPGGAFPWFGGEYADRYITQHILAGIGQLTHLNIADTKNQVLKDIADKAMAYLDKSLTDDANREKLQNTYEGRNLSAMEIHSYFTQSYFTSRIISAETRSLLANYLHLAEIQWKNMNVYEQTMIALTMHRNNKPQVAQMIIHSLIETAQHSDDMGMYWAKNQLGYYWYQSPVETQSLMIELFTEASTNNKAVEEMKIWLLRNKQTSNWKTTKATAAACYALLTKGNNGQDDNGTSEIKLGDKPLSELKPDSKADDGTGYIKTIWTDEQVKPALGKVDIQNNGKTISWGAIHWQYLENLDKITSSKTDIQLERKYFILKQTDSGSVLTAVDMQHQPKTGDLLKVVMYLKAGRDFEYLQLKDMRPAGTEPVDVLSNYKYQDGLYYYQVTKDVATNFFISNLNKGNYVFEYRLRVIQPGNFSTGITSVQSMYAPEFNAHSEGIRLLIKQN